jgi:hypothetical protein
MRFGNSKLPLVQRLAVKVSLSGFRLLGGFVAMRN